jgi:hypothetical protein
VRLPRAATESACHVAGLHPGDARSFFKMEKPGTFARMHAQLLQKNNWDCIAQEILISTPRRFGKTISECPAPAAPHAVPVRGPRTDPAYRCQHVLRGPAAVVSFCRDQHLLHVQADLAEDIEERHEVRYAHLPTGLEFNQLRHSKRYVARLWERCRGY